MEHRYPVLAAALALDAFTLEELADRTGIGIESIRSVVRRDTRFEEAGLQEPNGPGGRRKLYRVRESAVPEVYGELQSLFAGIVQAVGGQDEAAQPVRPVALDAALELIEAAQEKELSAAERQTLLAMARPDLVGARTELERRHGSGATDAMSAIGELLESVDVTMDGGEGMQHVARAAMRARNAFDHDSVFDRGRALLARLRSTLRNPPMPAPMPQFVLLLNGAGATASRLVRELERTIREEDGTPITFDADDVFEQAVQLPASAHTRMRVLLVDSDHADAQLQFDRVCLQVGTPSLVLDVAGNPAVRNHVFERDADYQALATKLSGPALEHIVRRTVEAEKQSAAPAV